jgi:hypothetical protein
MEGRDRGMGERSVNEVRSQKSEVRSQWFDKLTNQSFVVETGIYALLQQRFPFKGEVLDPAL